MRFTTEQNDKRSLMLRMRTDECVIYLFFQLLYDWVRDSDCYKAQPVWGNEDMIDNTGVVKTNERDISEFT